MLVNAKHTAAALAILTLLFLGIMVAATTCGVGVWP